MAEASTEELVPGEREVPLKLVGEVSGAALEGAGAVLVISPDVTIGISAESLALLGAEGMLNDGDVISFRVDRDEEPTRVRLGDLVVDYETSAILRDGDAFTLASKELALFSALVRGSGRLVTREQLINDIWNGDCDRNTLDSHILRLRRALGDTEHKMLRTVRGKGFVLRDPSEKMLDQVQGIVEVQRDTVRALEDVVIDYDARAVLIGGVIAKFTKMEYELFVFLVKNAGKVMSRHDILENVWGPGYAVPGVNNKTIDVHIRRIRKVLGNRAWSIRTSRGIGYGFNGRQPESDESNSHEPDL